VPPDLVSPDARTGLDFGNEEAREAFYTNVLNDVRMAEEPDPTTLTPEQGGNLTPSCVSDNDGDGVAESRAYPPRRIVEVARRFGTSGMVQSICQADLAEPVDAIVETIGSKLGEACLPRPLLRGDDGKVGCDVIWELPVPAAAPTSTPVICDQLPYLRKLERQGASGGEVCAVTQLPIQNPTVPLPHEGEGWFYDDFSSDLLSCAHGDGQRIAFSANAKPPSGVRVTLECCD